MGDVDHIRLFGGLDVGDWFCAVTSPANKATTPSVADCHLSLRIGLCQFQVVVNFLRQLGLAARISIWVNKYPGRPAQNQSVDRSVALLSITTVATAGYFGNYQTPPALSARNAPAVCPEYDGAASLQDVCQLGKGHWLQICEAKVYLADQFRPAAGVAATRSAQIVLDFLRKAASCRRQPDALPKAQTKCRQSFFQQGLLLK